MVFSLKSESKTRLNRKISLTSRKSTVDIWNQT